MMAERNQQVKHEQMIKKKEGKKITHQPPQDLILRQALSGDFTPACSTEGLRKLWGAREKICLKQREETA